MPTDQLPSHTSGAEKANRTSPPGPAAAQPRIRIEYRRTADELDGVLAAVRFGEAPRPSPAPFTIDVRLTPLNGSPTIEAWLANGAVRTGTDGLVRYAHDDGFLFAATPLVAVQASGPSVLSRPYDGSDSIDLTPLNLGVTGLRSGQTLVGDLRLADRNAGDAKALVPAAGAQGNTVVADDGTPIFGYAFDTSSLQVNVTPLTLNLSQVQATGKVYDGSTSATIARWTLSGLLEGDQVSVASGTASFSDANVGSAKPVTASAAASSARAVRRVASR